MRWVIVILTVGVIILGSFLFIYNFINRPKPEIIEVSELGLNYDENLLLLNVTVRNNGFDGSFKVYVRFGNIVHVSRARAVREELMSLAYGESEIVQFTYTPYHSIEEIEVSDTWTQVDTPLQQTTMVASGIIVILGSVSLVLQLQFMRKRRIAKASVR